MLVLIDSGTWNSVNKSDVNTLWHVQDCAWFSVVAASVSLFQITTHKSSKMSVTGLILKTITLKNIHKSSRQHYSLNSERDSQTDSFQMLTFHTAAAGLQDPGVHVCLGMGEKLVPSQVRVVRGGDEVVTQRLIHVLIHLVVQRVENVARRTAHETCKT